MKNKIGVLILGKWLWSSIIFTSLVPFSLNAVTTVKGQYNQNGVFLGFSYVNYQSWIDKVPNVANNMKNNFDAPYWFVNIGLLDSTGKLNPVPSKVVEFLNKLKEWEDQNGYQFKVLAWFNADANLVDLSNAGVRANNVTECQRFVSISVPGSYIAGANRTFDGVCIDYEPTGLDTTRFNNYKLLMDEIKQGFINIGAPNKLVAVTPHKYGANNKWYWQKEFYYEMAPHVDFIVGMTYNSSSASGADYQSWMQFQTYDILRAVSGKSMPGDPPSPTNGVKVFIGQPAYPANAFHNPDYENIKYGAQGMDAGVTNLVNDTLDPSEDFFQGGAIFLHGDGLGADGHMDLDKDGQFWVEHWLGDKVAPAGISDLTALTGSDAGEITLKWTAPGNDETTRDFRGNYVIKYSSVGIINSADFDTPPVSLSVNQTVVITSFAASNVVAPKSPVQKVLQGLQVGTTYWIAIKSTDTTGNTSIWNSSADVTTINVLASTTSSSKLPAIWDGGGTDNLWSTPANWLGDAVPVDGQNILFDATSSKGATADIAGVSFGSITITPGYTGWIEQSTHVVFTRDFTINNSSWTVGIHNLIVSGRSSVSNSTVTIGNSSEIGWTTNEMTINDGGVVSCSASQIRVSGNWTTGASSIFAVGTSTVTFAANSTLSFNRSVNPNFYNAVVEPGVVITFSGSVDNNLDIMNFITLAGILQQSGSGKTLMLRKSAGGKPLINNGGTISLSQVKYRPTSGVTVVEATNYPQLYLAPSVSLTFQLAGNLTADWLRIGDLSDVVTTLDTTGNNYSIIVTTLSLGVSGSTVRHGVLTANGSAIEVNGDLLFHTTGSVVNANSSNWKVRGNWDNSRGGSFNMGTSIVSFVGTGSSQTIITSSQPFNNLAISKQDSGDKVYTKLTSITVTNLLSVTSGQLSLQTSGFFGGGVSIETAGSLIATNSLTSLTFGDGSTVTVKVGGTLEISGNAGNQILLRSLTEGATWYVKDEGANIVKVYGADVRDSNASTGEVMIATDSINSGNNTNWDFEAPEAISDLTALTGTNSGEINLNWTSPGNDGTKGNFSGSYVIKYSSMGIIHAADFDTPPAPLSVSEMIISTSGVVPDTAVGGIINGLQLGTKYWFAIKARDTASRYSIWNSSADVPTVNTFAFATAAGVGAPTNVKFFGVTVDSVSITWDLESGNNYLMALTTATDFSVLTASGVGALNQNSTSYSGLTSGATYFFKVKVNAPLAEFSIPISTLTNVNAPGIIGFQIFTTSVSVTLSPNGNSLGTTLSISTGLFESSSSSSGVSGAENTTLGISNLVANRAYLIQARAIGFGGDISSQTVIASTATLPAAPGVVSFDSVGNNFIAISWDPNGNSLTPATSYQVQISSNDPSFSTYTTSNTFLLNVTTNSLSESTTYYFRVFAFGVGGTDSMFNASVPTQTLSAAILSAPSGFRTTSISTISIGFEWTDNSTNELGFRILNSTDGIYGTVSANTTFFILSDLSPDTKVIARVAAFNSTTVSTAAVVITSHTLANIPTDISFSNAKGTELTLCWNQQNNPGTVIYEVSYSTSGTFGIETTTPVPFSANLSGGCTSIFSLSANTTYFFRVRAKNRDSIETFFSVSASTVTSNVGLIFCTGGTTNAGETTVTTNPGVCITNIFLLDGTTQQIFVSTQVSNIIFGNGVSLELPGGVSAKVLATMSGITLTSTQTVPIFDSNIRIETTSGTVLVQSLGNVLTIKIAENSPQKMKAVLPITTAKTVVVVLNPPTGEIRTEFPAGAFPDQITVQVQIPDSLPITGDTSFKPVGIGVEILKDKSIQPNKPVTFGISYRDSDILGMNPEWLRIRRFDEPLQKWVPILSSNVDPLLKKVSGFTNHLSKFQIVLVTQASGEDQFLVKDNLFNPIRGEQCKIVLNLLKGSKVKIGIYAVDGRKVRTLTEEYLNSGERQWNWDGRNDQGDFVASDIYFIAAEAPDDSNLKVIRKVIVVK